MILPDAYADITNGSAAVPPKTLGEATRGLLVALPGMLLPDSSQPHPIRQPVNIAVCSAFFRSDEAPIQVRDITRSSRFSHGSSSTRTGCWSRLGALCESNGLGVTAKP